MKQKAQAMLKFLLSASENQDDLLRFLPPALAEEVQSLPPRDQVDTRSLFSLKSWVHPIHFSWLSEVIQEFPRSVQPFFLGVLSAAQTEKMQKNFPAQEKPKEISPFLRPFLLQVLKKNLGAPDLLAEELLPPSALNLLLKLERKQLLHLIDFLGLHDLSTDLRQIVDKDLLQKIQQALSPSQRHFLQYCSKQPLKWVSPKLGLSSWDGSQKLLNHLLHFRGLNRLGKAVAQEHPSFKWHLLHRFDTGRAKVLQKEFYRKQDPALLPFFKNQVLHIAKRYQP